MNEKPARAAAALGTLAVAGFYLIAQMVGAGLLIDALVGIGFAPSVLLTGIFMLTYVVFGGMIATTWVQIVKAVLLMAAAIVMSIFVLVKVGNPIDIFRDARSSPVREPIPRAGPVPDEPDRHDLAGPGPGARHGGPAAHPDAVLHRPRRQGRAQVRGLGRRR